MLGTTEVAKVVGRRKSPGKGLFNLKFFALLIGVSGLERGWGKRWDWELSGNLDRSDISFSSVNLPASLCLMLRGI